MMYPREVIEDVRIGNDIVGLASQYVTLRQRGGSYVGLCPFHREKTPSFTVSPDKQLYYCFGCGASGNVISFAMQIENYDFTDALRFLADRIRYALPEKELSPEYLRQIKLKEDVYEINRTAAKFFYERLNSPVGAGAAAYLDGRGVGKRARVAFGLGYCPEDKNELGDHLASAGVNKNSLSRAGLVGSRFYGRLMFPIFDVSGRVTGFGARSLNDGGAKYLNSPETPVFEKSKNLYGINFARLSRRREFILVEGYTDVVSLYQYGFKNAVASLGTSFNAEHVRLLKKYCEGVVLLFDSDEAGAAAVDKAIPIIEAGGLKVNVLRLAGAKDPDEFLRTNGPEAFAERLADAQSAVAYKIGGIKDKHDLGKTEGRIAFTTGAAGVLSQLTNMIERDAYIKQIAADSGISREAIARETDKLTERGAEFVANRDPRLSYAERGALNERGVTEAAKAAISLAAADARLCGAIRENLDPSELPSPVYTKLLEAVFEARDAGRHIYGAELVSIFTEIDEQKKASDVFATAAVDAYGENIGKTLTELLKKIKLFKIERDAMLTADPVKLREYTGMKNAVGGLDIKIN